MDQLNDTKQTIIRKTKILEDEIHEKQSRYDPHTRSTIDSALEDR